MLTVLL
jgi:hypothetical protein